MKEEDLDQDLWASIQQHNHRAFEILFIRYFPQLRNMAHSAGAAREEAEELASDVLHQLWTKRNSIQLQGALSYYLFACIKNARINQKKKKALLITSLESQMEINQATAEAADVAILNKESGEYLDEILAFLPKRQSQIFRLIQILGYTNQEVAIMLGITEGTVAVQLSKATKKIRHLWKTGISSNRMSTMVVAVSARNISANHCANHNPEHSSCSNIFTKPNL